MTNQYLPDGKYRAVPVPVTTESGEVLFAQIGESSQRGTPFVAVNFRIIDGDWSGETIPWIGHLTDKTAQRTIESLRYCGFVGDDLAGVETQRLSQIVELEIKHEPSQKDPSKTFPRVRWVNRPSSGAVLKGRMDPSARRRIADELKALVKSSTVAPGEKAQPQHRQPRAQADASSSGGQARAVRQVEYDDDMPF